MTNIQTSLIIGDIAIFYDFEKNYLAISNHKIKKLMIFNPEQFIETFTMLLLHHGQDYPINKER